MSQLPANFNASPFDAIRHEDARGEWWSARELADLLIYSKWQSFQEVIQKAKTATENSGQPIDRHFTDIRKVTSGGKHGHQTISDIRLTRYACYLIAQNADPTKEIVANAQTYFAVMTRQQELTNSEDANYLEWRQRAIASYLNAGYSVEWAELRVDDITAKNELTHEWVVRGIKQEEISILTNSLHMDAFGISINDHKGVKDFPITYKGKKLVYKGDLPPALTRTELALNALASTLSRELHVTNDSHGFPAIASDVHMAGEIVGHTRQEIEAATGRPVVSPRNMIREPDGGLWRMLSTPDASND